MIESEIRDLLANQLSCLSLDLQLLNKEKYIPDSIGTRSFIDILAQNGNGKWVLIELKRSDGAARQAIHELNKYVEAVKRHFVVRDDEIIVFVVSTEWSELLSPFSRFAADTSISVKGFFLDISDPDKLVATRVQPLSINGGRALAPWHELNTYQNKRNLQKGILSYEKACAAKKIEEYILVILKAPVGFHEHSLESTRAALREVHARFGNVDEEEIEAVVSRMGRSDYMIYFVPRLIDVEKCLDILSRDHSAFEEATDFLKQTEGEEALLYLHESIYAAEPYPYRDHLEIGYAAKFKSKILDSEGWIVQEILRYGSFNRNYLLSNEVLMEEIAGSTGSSGQKFKRSIELADKAQYEGAIKEIKECLQNNPMWLEDILQSLQESKSEFPEGCADINIYCPTAGLFTIFLATTQPDGVLNLPLYGISIRSPHCVRAYFGELVPEGQSHSFNAILGKYYNGDIGSLLMVATFGYYEPRDSEILEDAGLLYRSFKKDIADGADAFFERRNGRWRQRKEAITPIAGFKRFVEENQTLIANIAGKIGPRQSAGMFDGSNASTQLDGLADEAESEKRDTFYIDPPNACNFCSIDFSSEKYMVDGVVTRGVWANMCADCHMVFGQKIEWGSGQLYRREPDNRFKLVAGFRPIEYDEE